MRLKKARRGKVGTWRVKTGREEEGARWWMA